MHVVRLNTDAQCDGVYLRLAQNRRRGPGRKCACRSARSRREHAHARRRSPKANHRPTTGSPRSCLAPKMAIRRNKSWRVSHVGPSRCVNHPLLSPPTAEAVRPIPKSATPSPLLEARSTARSTPTSFANPAGGRPSGAARRGLQGECGGGNRRHKCGGNRRHKRRAEARRLHGRRRRKGRPQAFTLIGPRPEEAAAAVNCGGR